MDEIYHCEAILKYQTFYRTRQMVYFKVLYKYLSEKLAISIIIFISAIKSMYSDKY